MLRQALRARNVTQRELAERLGVSDDVVNSIVAGITKMKPARKALIAGILGISVTELTAPPADSNVVSLGGSATIRSGAAPVDIAKGFAVTAAVRAWNGALASPLDAECYFEEAEERGEVPTAFLVGGYSKVELHDLVRVAGTSMAPRIESGEQVLIFRDATPRANTIVLAESPDHRMFLKVLRMSLQTEWYLESINPAVEPIEDLSGWTVHGYAVVIMGEAGSKGRNIEWDTGRALKA